MSYRKDLVFAYVRLTKEAAKVAHCDFVQVQLERTYCLDEFATMLRFMPVAFAFIYLSNGAGTWDYIGTEAN